LVVPFFINENNGAFRGCMGVRKKKKKNKKNKEKSFENLGSKKKERSFIIADFGPQKNTSA